MNTYEKKYKEALGWIQSVYPTMTGADKENAEHFFPELKESEDERNIKDLIDELKCSLRAANCQNEACNGGHEKRIALLEWAIAWLEKQSEQKPTDKIKPEFKVGDWIVRGDTIAQILDIQKEYYVGLDINGKDFTLSKFLNDDKIHLWTIADAKAGAVLIKEETGEPFIYNGNRGTYLPEFVGAYCGIRNGEFTPEGSLYHYWGRPTYPATKEQRDSLFAKMKEAGYKWDSENNELKTIEQKPIDKTESKFHKGNWITNGDYTWEIVEVKPLDYILQSQDGNIVDDTISHVDEHFHLWSIHDAKDGDVLVTPPIEGLEHNEQIFIFKAINNRDYIDDCIEYYGRLCDGVFYKNKTSYMGTTLDTFYPATKEQRDLLFSKMEEANYKWDAENKELNKIESKTLDANKVIEWLKTTIKEVAENYGVYKETRLILPYHSVEDLINNFKEDFGL